MQGGRRFRVGKSARIVESRRRRGRKPQDRKSTRLNSSHVRISYAVFCLKKKTKNSPVELGAEGLRRAYTHPVNLLRGSIVYHSLFARSNTIVNARAVKFEERTSRAGV